MKKRPWQAKTSEKTKMKRQLLLALTLGGLLSACNLTLGQLQPVDASMSQATLVSATETSLPPATETLTPAPDPTSTPIPSPTGTPTLESTAIPSPIPTYAILRGTVNV